MRQLGVQSVLLDNSRIRQLEDSRTGHLAEWSTRGLDNSRIGQVADWTNRGCHRVRRNTAPARMWGPQHHTGRSSQG